MFSNIVSSCPAIPESVNFILLVVPSQYNDLPEFEIQFVNKVPMGKYNFGVNNEGVTKFCMDLFLVTIMLTFNKDLAVWIFFQTEQKIFRFDN